ncbi:hypothetical protein AcW1_008170 [Taiwanofungus camphoratus]|nr:hypothetical protein AcW1_008170 [Antrodia cinnamomea]
MTAVGGSYQRSGSRPCIEWQEYFSEFKKRFCIHFMFTKGCLVCANIYCAVNSADAQMCSTWFLEEHERRSRRLELAGLDSALDSKYSIGHQKLQEDHEHLEISQRT